MSTSTSEIASQREELAEKSSSSSRGWYQWLLIGVSVLFAVVSISFVGSIIIYSIPAWAHPGTLLTGKGWQSPTGPFGGFAMIIGTFETSLIALVVAGIVGLGTSLSIVFLVPGKFRNIIATLVELLAAIPSIVYGLWGFLVLAPWMLKTFDPFVNKFPFASTIFGSPGQQFGPSLMLASIVLSVMILPTFVAISREVISAVPSEIIEASYSLGATR